MTRASITLALLYVPNQHNLVKQVRSAVRFPAVKIGRGGFWMHFSSGSGDKAPRPFCAEPHFFCADPMATTPFGIRVQGSTHDTGTKPIGKVIQTICVCVYVYIHMYIYCMVEGLMSIVK